MNIKFLLFILFLIVLSSFVYSIPVENEATGVGHIADLMNYQSMVLIKVNRTLYLRNWTIKYIQSDTPNYERCLIYEWNGSQGLIPVIANITTNLTNATTKVCDFHNNIGNVNLTSGKNYTLVAAYPTFNDGYDGSVTYPIQSTHLNYTGSGFYDSSTDTWSYESTTARGGITSIWTELIDSNPPTFSNNKTNATSTTPRTNEELQINITITDEGGIHTVWFAHNQSGIMTNVSILNYTDTSETSIDIVINLSITMTKGRMAYQFWVNDSGNYTGNYNISDIFLVEIKNTAPVAPTINYPVDGRNYTDIPHINYSSTDTDDDAITYYIYINGSLNITTTINVTDWNASDGYYNLTVSAWDGSFSSDNSSVVNFRLDSTVPSWSNNETNASLMKINGNATFNITVSDYGSGLSFYIFSWNGTGIWLNDTNGTISGNSIKLVINKSTNLSQGNTINYIWYANDSLNQWNNSGYRTFTVANTAPNISSVELNDTSIESSIDDINITCTASDTDLDALTYSYQWFINQTLTTYTTYHLGKGNMSSNANITGSCRAYDNIDYSSWSNTSTVLVGDLTPPTLNDFSLSSSVGTSTNITANCSDNGILETNYPYVAIFHVGNKVLENNNSMSLATGNQYYRYYTFGTSGDYNFTFYCKDTSGNSIMNDTNGLLFTYSLPSPSSPGGGGGGSITPSPQECISTKDCKIYGDKYVCIQNKCIYQPFEKPCNYNGICEPDRGETTFNCRDEYVNNTLFLEGDCHWTNLDDVLRIAVQSEIFLWIVFIAMIIGTVGIIQAKEGSFVKRTYKKYKPKFRKFK